MKIFFPVLLLICFNIGLFAQTNSINRKPKYGFIENKGQLYDQYHKTCSDVKYILYGGNGLNVQLRKNGFSYDTYSIEKAQQVSEVDINSPEKFEFKEDIYFFHRVDIELLGSKPDPQIIAEDQAPDYLNYYNSVTPETGLTKVGHFRKITYKDIYPGIDLLFEARNESNSTVEYSFIIHPGADASLIKLHYSGANKSDIINGKICLELTRGSVCERIPASWIDETKTEIEVNYRCVGKNSYSFVIPEYDKSKTLVIDPNPDLIWGTYFGGPSGEVGYGICYNGHGDIYLTGITGSLTNIATSGAFQSTIAGSSDVFVSKFSSVGSIEWATYYGGSGVDFPFAISCNSDDFIFISGYTTSSTGTGIATAGAHQTSKTSAQDAFLAKFDSSGTRLWGTYYGGFNDDDSRGVACDSQGNVFIAGYTNSNNNISTAGGYQPVYSGGTDVFVAKFNASGVRQWGSYFGGDDHDYCFAITCDSLDNFYLAGRTCSSSGIATSGTFQQTITSLYNEAYIVKFKNNGTRVWGTYYGHSGEESGYGIACDKDCNVFLIGTTNSYSGMATTGSHQTFWGGDDDAFVAKFDSSGNRIWGTYYGGSMAEIGYGISCDKAGMAYITGYTYSSSGIATSNSQQTVIGGSPDAFVAKFGENGVLNWATYYGGEGLEMAFGITSDGYQSVFVTGETKSATGISTAGAYQDSLSGLQDVFLARFSSCNPANADSVTGPIFTCRGISALYSVPVIAGALTYEWSLPNNASGSSISNVINVDFGASFDSGYVSVRGLNSCGYSDFGSSVFVRAQIPDVPSICLIECDSASQKNRVLFSPIDSTTCDSVFVYREETLGNWIKVGCCHSGLNSFLDSTSNPTVQSYNYHISVFDSCGLEGQFSTNHKTITLIKSYDQLSNYYSFIWSLYEGLAVSQYKIFGVMQDGSSSLIGVVPGNVNMYNYSNPSTLYVNYFVGFDAPACDSAKAMHLVRSNYVSSVTTGNEEHCLDKVLIYPSPVIDYLFIESETIGKKISIQVLNSIGQVVYNGLISGKGAIPFTGFTSGMYVLKLDDGNSITFRKVLKE